jgi:Tol biopolymer transport system component
MFASWLRRWLKQTSPTGKSQARRPHSRLLELEALEDRCVPSTLRTITYDQITSLSSSAPLNTNAHNLLDANGNRAVFSTYNNGVTQVFTINSDGSGLTLVDPDNGSNGRATLDLSADGSVVLESIVHGNTGTEYRIVNADGSNMHDALDTGTLEEFSSGRLSPDGSTVFFTADGAFPVPGQSQNDAPGLYAVAADGQSAPQQTAATAT